ncbi:MAG: type II toxin-antitoxin system RelE/ParE family toxin [Syntrophobacteraceae bacterium]
MTATHCRRIWRRGSGLFFPPCTRRRKRKGWDIPAFRLHRLKGDLKGIYAVTVRANWRIIFRF